ncbi:MAG: pectate lyase [Acidobacteria bacterium]|nr:pectate lyase [Acidobacteriota bacterium]
MRVRRPTSPLAAALLVVLTMSDAATAATRPEGVDLVVAQDGSGDVTTVQAALDALPQVASRIRVILVRRGIYREKVFITKSRLALVGEDRDATRIEFDVLRRDWRASHPDDWGAAVVNIGDDVTDLLLANLTIRNDYGSRNGGDHDHQFALRSGGNSSRIALVHVNALSDGGDTVSLWNPFGGMTYYASCTFEGWVDFLCPRGTAYVTSSEFVAHSPTAAIWHDGSKDRDHKMVIRSSRFEGDPGFPLGRNNRDGQFYLLDCVFSANMADRPIYQPSAPETYAWEPRSYFDDCRSEGGDLPWIANNLRTADFAPAPSEITAEWTFCGQWDPEGMMPAVLPFAALPRPNERARNVPLFGVRLRWAAARGARSHELFFGPGDGPPLVSRLEGTAYDTGPLAPATRYSWRVDAIGPGGRVGGKTWTFETAAAPSRIALAGDSTVTERQGWGTGFASHLRPGAVCSNHARGGRSSKSFVDEGHWKKVLAERPDFVLIQFGHNDAPGKGPERETDPTTTYRENLARMVDEARAVGVRPVLLTPLTRRYVDEVGCIRSDLGAYAEGVLAVAAERRVPVIDLHRLSIEVLERMTPSEVAALGVPKEDGTLDRTHLSPLGSVLFGGLVAEELARVVPELRSAVRPAGPVEAPSAGVASDDGAAESEDHGVRRLAERLDRPVAFFSTSEAARIGENLLLWQRSNGGWPKNINMVRPLDLAGRERVLRGRRREDTTIDNGATYTQIRFLARLHEVARDGRFKAGALAGIDFLLRAQYPNGGWPQFFPLREDYSRFITFNDGAMAGVLALLRNVAAGRGFDFVDSARRARAALAVEKGTAAILATQIAVNGRKTAWGAQHDAVSLEPRPARAFEPAALASSESVSVLRFLMSLPSPSQGVRDAIEAGVEWLRSVRIEGLRIARAESPSLPKGGDVVVTPDPAAPPTWARFYEIGTNRPLFAGRDGVVRSSLAEIEHERRTGYAWYVDSPAALLATEYPAWKAKLLKEAP